MSMEHETWQKYLLHELSENLKMAERVKKLSEKFIEEIEDIRPSYGCLEDFENLKKDVEREIHIPLWNDMSHCTPDDLVSYTDNTFLIWDDGGNHAYKSMWDDSKKKFRIWDDEEYEWVEWNIPVRYWIPICPPSLY